MVFSITLRVPHYATPLPKSSLQLRYSPFILLPQHPSTSRVPIFHGEGVKLVDDPRRWRRTVNSVRGGVDDCYEDDGGDDNDEEERSLDLLVRFLRNMFKKVSKKARTAVRSVLPQAISTKLVGFSVNGVLILAFLWIFKAFLEVVCTLGSVVFVSILLIRGVWSGVTYLQENRSQKINNLDEEFHTWNGMQPVNP